jgi:Zn finger protein HypA/HybF involved in hydrogenase expression
MVAPGSIAEGAEVEIAEQLAVAYCFNCDTEVLVRRRADVCPRCGSFRLQVKTGHEVVVLTCEGD